MVPSELLPKFSEGQEHCHNFQAIYVPAQHWVCPRAKGRPAITQCAPASPGGVCHDYLLSGNQAQFHTHLIQMGQFSGARVLVQPWFPPRIMLPGLKAGTNN